MCNMRDPTEMSMECYISKDHVSCVITTMFSRFQLRVGLWHPANNMKQTQNGTCHIPSEEKNSSDNVD